MAETDLAKLLGTMRPILAGPTYVFVTIPGERPPADLSFLSSFAEEEGLSLILEQKEAERAGLASTFPCRRISLSVHSALQAVGLTAAVSRALTDAGISANVVAAFHHDHLFVPAAAAEAALRVLNDLSARGVPTDN